MASLLEGMGLQDDIKSSALQQVARSSCSSAEVQCDMARMLHAHQTELQTRGPSRHCVSPHTMGN